jgi:uncharacterized protein
MTALNSEATIRKILNNSKTIALVGASQNPERPSNYVMKFLLDHNYDVIPINPGLEGQELYGKTVFGSLSSIPKTVEIDMVDIFRNSAAVPPIVDEAIEAGAKYIWMQMGVVNEEAADKARRAGLDVVQDACPKVSWEDVVEEFSAFAATLPPKLFLTSFDLSQFLRFITDSNSPPRNFWTNNIQRVIVYTKCAFANHSFFVFPYKRADFPCGPKLFGRLP